MRLSVQIEFDKTMDLLTHKNIVTVGRASQCDLVIPKDSISRQHCKIEKNKGEFFITDTGSSNGVFIDGERIPQNVRRILLKGSQLKISGFHCEVSDQMPQIENKIVSSTVSNSGDFTATIRLARLDLSEPAPIKIETNKRHSQRPRNPVAGSPNDDVQVVRSKKGFIVLFLGILLAVAWFMAPR